MCWFRAVRALFRTRVLPVLSPLVVPRRVEFDEVVDNHQVPFVTMMEKQGGAVIVESRADLFRQAYFSL